MKPLVVVMLAAACSGLAGSAWAVDDIEHTKDKIEDVKKLVTDKKAVLLDVREKDEWDAGHLARAKLLPLSKLRDNSDVVNQKKLPKDMPIYVHCRSGGRALVAGKILKDLGFDVRPLKPGYQQLLDNGFEKAKGNGDRSSY